MKDRCCFCRHNDVTTIVKTEGGFKRICNDQPCRDLVLPIMVSEVRLPDRPDMNYATSGRR